MSVVYSWCTDGHICYNGLKWTPTCESIIHCSLTPWNLAGSKIPFKVWRRSVYPGIAEIAQRFGLVFGSSDYYEQVIYCTTEGFSTQILLNNCKVIICNCKEMSQMPIRCTLLEFYDVYLSYECICYMWTVCIWKTSCLLYQSGHHTHAFKCGVIFKCC